MDPNPRTCPDYNLGGLPRHIFEIGMGQRGHKLNLNNDPVPTTKEQKGVTCGHSGNPDHHVFFCRNPTTMGSGRDYDYMNRHKMYLMRHDRQHASFLRRTSRCAALRATNTASRACRSTRASPSALRSRHDIRFSWCRIPRRTPWSSRPSTPRRTSRTRRRTRCREPRSPLLTVKDTKTDPSSLSAPNPKANLAGPTALAVLDPKERSDLMIMSQEWMALFRDDAGEGEPRPIQRQLYLEGINSASLRLSAYAETAERTKLLWPEAQVQAAGDYNAQEHNANVVWMIEWDTEET
jgi:hypothetical protein